MIRSRFLLLSLLFALSVPVLSACTPLGVAVGAGATAGVAAQQEGGLNTAANDTGIRAQINRLWFEKDIEMMRRVGLSVSNGRVLLTGIVPKAEDRVEAVRLVWQVQGVREVINEIRVDGEEGSRGGSYATDVWISTQLRSKLLFDSQINAINYSVETIHSIVYLMGVAVSREELERVINHARNISGVNRVVNHVLLKGDPQIRTPSSAPESGPVPATAPAQSEPAPRIEPAPSTQSAPIQRVPLQ
ncbi:BON domain-containing protein [Oceanibaculum indicum]|uniref:Putative phospholipid-binding domain-containing protein n=1 Tax=Oceanibaculum indicum P24 TaxID=1207063 RepID=K2JSD7_9PROT|nr:BON domain-containing protein [Oceanibaculum indicum]EKE78388.1 putative phospholipid-binding domain-containing protein [Oceanibaculum indicum P24]